ncbi:MAG: twin-arginine translocase subunit TatC [Fimbriimonadaceae bacterium]|nr:twin-arginine translocase subunit TatC [Fimbriimonadaceae bacterium]
MLRRKSSANPEKEMPFTEHLEELRWHLLRCIFYLVVAFAVGWHYYDGIYALMSRPVMEAFRRASYHTDLVFMDILEPLLFRIQVVFAASVIVGLPLMLWEAWRFVAPGLYENERRFAAPLMPFSILLCFAGFALIYYALPIAFEFLLKFAPPQDEAKVMQHLNRYYFLLLRMMIAAAVSFQMPIVMLLLGRLEIVSSRGLMRFWRHAVLACFTLAAVITPTIDPFNMSVIAVPLVLLYFLSVVLVWFVERRRRAEAQPEPPAETPLPANPPALPPPVDPPAAPPAKPDSLLPPEAPLTTTPLVVDRSVLQGPPDDTAEPTDEALFDPDA